MDFYEIVWKRSAEKELRKIDVSQISRIVTEIESLSKSPYLIGCRKLAGGETAFRIRIGDYRVIYRVDKTLKIITIEHIRHRKEAYRRT
jgi:mRNA interferase RelE/StbE